MSDHRLKYQCLSEIQIALNRFKRHPSDFGQFEVQVITNLQRLREINEREQMVVCGGKNPSKNVRSKASHIRGKPRVLHELSNNQHKSREHRELTPFKSSSNVTPSNGFLIPKIRLPRRSVSADRILDHNGVNDQFGFLCLKRSPSAAGSLASLISPRTIKLSEERAVLTGILKTMPNKEEELKKLKDIRLNTTQGKNQFKDLCDEIVAGLSLGGGGSTD